MIFKNIWYGLERLCATLATIIANIFLDLVVLGAVVLISYGAWSIYAPAGYITLGVLLIGLAYLSMMTRPDVEEDVE